MILYDYNHSALVQPFLPEETATYVVRIWWNRNTISWHAFCEASLGERAECLHFSCCRSFMLTHLLAFWLIYPPTLDICMLSIDTKKTLRGFLWCSDMWDENGPGGGIWIISSQNIPKPQQGCLSCRCVCVWLNPLHLHNSRCSV